MKVLNKLGHMVFDMLPDKKYLEVKYYYRMKKKLNLTNPKTYNEKLQWIKLYDRKDLYTTMVDKYEVKKYVSNIIGEEYIIPTYGVWDRAEDINFDELPSQFVLKCTHDSGSIVVCQDKSKLNYTEVIKKLNKALKKSAFIDGREWPYKNVKRRIIAEKFMVDSEDKELRDYKFFTFNSEPKILYIAQGRGSGREISADFYDMEFNHLDMKIDHQMAHEMGMEPPHPPKNFELMKDLAKKLSKGTPEVRVDFYEVDGKVYFGELTFFHCSGFISLKPESWEYTLGEWIKLDI